MSIARSGARAGAAAFVMQFSPAGPQAPGVAAAVPQLGDVTFFAGFLIAGASYLTLCRPKIATERRSS